MSHTIKFAPGLKPVIKHGNHDQSSHGNWADSLGEQPQWNGKNLTEELKSYFGSEPGEYLLSDGYKEISRRDREAKENKRGWENHALQIIAEKQGFAEKPKVVTPEDMDKLQEEGWVIAYRGIQDYSHDGKTTTVSANQLAEEFKTGDYYAGGGTDGDGMYFTTTKSVAEFYAGDKGVVLKVAIPPRSTLTQTEFHEEITSHWENVKSKKQSFWGAEDIGVSLAAQGFRGAESLRKLQIKGGEAKIAPVFVIWDRSMLAVEGAKK